MLRWGGCCFQMQFSLGTGDFACGCALWLYPQRKSALYKVEQRHAVYCDGIVHRVVAGQCDGVHCAVNICECPHGVGSVGSSPAVGETTGHRDHHQLIVGSGKGSVIRRFTVFRQRNIIDLIPLVVRDKFVVLGNLFGACDDPCVHAVRRFT